MHELAEKNKYVAFLFMKISPEYFALGRDGIHEVSAGHARDMGRYAKLLTHVVCSGVDARYDQVTMVEADTLEEIHAAATDFRMGAKARYIEIVDIVVGMKAPPRGLAKRAAAE
ncbi:hypothetical protein AB0J90_03785 [Micromonospora sp. NPDC049523]|uniref:hypothetical protein n=1 Tax=unclassified Micromonospora TaxID=2617518 RepID=UPI002DD979BE|nr:hypothetical protein [Micromonospora sp. NBC_01796]WSA83108.1 hypothetical protein OIE47_22120 [Micromonospora sp. NBC_01796]